MDKSSNKLTPFLDCANKQIKVGDLVIMCREVREYSYFGSWSRKPVACVIGAPTVGGNLFYECLNDRGWGGYTVSWNKENFRKIKESDLTPKEKIELKKLIKKEKIFYNGNSEY